MFKVKTDVENITEIVIVRLDCLWRKEDAPGGVL